MSSTTPNTGDCEELPVPRKSDEWEAVGRDLLQAKLEYVSEELIRESFRKATGRIAEGEQLRQSDIQSMREALERAERALKLAARASPESTPNPDPWEYLDNRSKQEYINDVKSQGE